MHAERFDECGIGCQAGLVGIFRNHLPTRFYGSDGDRLGNSCFKLASIVILLYRWSIIQPRIELICRLISDWHGRSQDGVRLGFVSEKRFFFSDLC